MQLNNPTNCKAKMDNRVYSLYNKSLVKRMLNLMDFSAIENIKEDLEEHKSKKIGRPLILPDSVEWIFASIG